MASELFLVRFRNWLIIGGTAMRNAWGSTTKRNRWADDNPSASAASVWPRSTAWTDPRTISATWLEV